MPLGLLTPARVRTLCGAIILLGLSKAGSAAAEPPPNAVPDELAVIAAACRENRARIQTLQFSGTVTLTGRMLEGQWDPIAGETYNSQTRDFCVWNDGVNLRFDGTSNRTVDGGTREVVYNVPYGEHFCIATDADRQALKREFGTTQTTERNLITADEDYSYRPESNYLELGLRNPGRVEQHPEVAVALNRTFQGSALDEFVDRWEELAKRGDRSVEVTHLEAGQYLVRTTVNLVLQDQQPFTGIGEAVVDLDQGGNVISYVGQVNGQVQTRSQFEYMNVDGVWVVAHAEVAWPIGPDGVPMVNAVYEVPRAGVRINAPIDPRVFSFEGLAVRKGAYVSDQKAGETYVYDDVPVDVKAALWLAREMEKERANAAAEAPQSLPPAQVDAPAAMPQPGQASPPAVTAAVPKARPTSVPVATAPTSRAAPPTDTRPAATQPVATRPATTRPAASRPVSVVQVVQPDNPTLPPPAGRSFVPSPAVTAVVVTAGCAAALAIGIWKLSHRGAPPRAG
jgi:hypothetical protein